MATRANSRARATNGATVGYEAELWRMADALRGSMDAAEYKHVVLGLIFLKYISDAFEEKHARARGRARAGRRPRGPGRVPRQEHLLGAARRPAGRTCKAQAKQPTIGTARRRRDGGHRAGQPDAQGRAAEGVRPRRAGQAAARRAHRPHHEHPRRRRREPLEGRARPHLRVLPLAVRERRGQEGRRVLHAALRRQAAGRDDRAVQGARLRPMLRLLRHVRAVGGVHRGARRPVRRHQHLRAGVELHDLAAGEDEPRASAASTARSPTATASTTTGTRTSRPTSSSPTRRSTSATGAATGCARTSAGHTASRPRATPTSPGCSTSSTTSRRAASPASCSPTARCPRTSRARARSARTSSRPTSSTA